MAILNGEYSNSFEIRYHEFGGEDYDWIQYLLFFRHNGESIVRESDMKQNMKWHESRPPNALWIEDDGDDYLLPLVKMALKTDVPVYYEMLEEDLKLTISPSFNAFCLPITYKNFNCSREDALQELAEQQVRIGKFVPSYYDFAFEFHNRIFDESSPFATKGLLLRVMATRQEVERFCEQLTSEYHEFDSKYDMRSVFKTYKHWKPMV